MLIQTEERRSCRACMGNGCIHCNGRGSFRARVYRRTQTGTKILLPASVLEAAKAKIKQEAENRERVLARLQAV